VKGNL